MASSPSIPIQELCQGLRLENDVLQQLMIMFLEDLRLGLSDAGEEQSSLLCMLTLITQLPTGKERGQFLALEFSGNEIKVAIVKLKDNSFDMRAKQYAISDDLKKGSGIQLFDFFAQKIQDFCTTQKLWGSSLMLGFSFGFPYEQRSINSGILLRWTKEFSCTGVTGKDVVVLLEESIAKIKALNVKVMAIINSATGALLSCAWKTRMCRIGCRYDFGTNICYVEKVKHVSKYRGVDSDIIVINTECGNFGAANKMNFIQTGWDKELDDDSTCPGTQPFEKMTSLMYLSELVRRILVTAVQRNIILKGKMSGVIATIDSLPARTIFDVIQDTVGQHGARVALNALGYPAPCAQDCVDLEFVCSTVITRATNLMAAVFTALGNHLRYKEVVVGIDGTFVHWMTDASEIMKDKMTELNPNIKFSFALADDRGGLGAGLAACMAFASLTSKSVESIAKEDSFFQTRTFVSAESLGKGASQKSIAEIRSGSLDKKKSEKPFPKQGVSGPTRSNVNTNSRKKSMDKSYKSGGELKVIKAPVHGAMRSSAPFSTAQELKQLQAKKGSWAHEYDKTKQSSMIRGQSQIVKHQSSQRISSQSTSSLRRSLRSHRSQSTMSATRSRGNLTSSKSAPKLTGSKQSLVSKVRSKHSLSSDANLRRLSHGSRTDGQHSRRDITHGASKVSLLQKSTSMSNFPRSSQSTGKQRPSTTKNSQGSSRTPTEGSSKSSRQSTASLGRSASKADTRISRQSMREPSKMSLSHGGRAQSIREPSRTSLSHGGRAQSIREPSRTSLSHGGRAQSSHKFVKQDTANHRPSSSKQSESKSVSNSKSSSTALKDSRISAISLAKLYGGSPSKTRVGSSTKMKKEAQREASKMSVVHTGRAISATNLPTSKEQYGKPKQPPTKKSGGSKKAEDQGVSASISDSSKQHASFAGKDKRPSTQLTAKEKQSIQSSEKKTEAGAKKNDGPAKPTL